MLEIPCFSVMKKQKKEILKDGLESEARRKLKRYDGSKDIKATIAAADDALYQGKNQARNVVVCNRR